MGAALVAVAVAGAVAVALAAVPLWLAFFPWLPRDLGGAPNLDRRARRVRIPLESGEALDGWWVAGSKPAAVLVLHGYGRDHHRAWRYGAFLNAAGFGVLAIDFRSSRAFHRGARKPTTLGHHEVPDAEAALAWLSREPGLAGHAVGLLGESLGGAVALVVAARNPYVRTVVVDGAFSSGAEALEDASERWARLPGRPTARLARWIGRATTGFDPGAMDAAQAASMLADRPLLLIHGSRDNRLSERQVERLWEAAGAKDVVWIIPEAGHNEGWKVRRAEYESRVREFFDRHLDGAERLPHRRFAADSEASRVDAGTTGARIPRRASPPAR